MPSIRRNRLAREIVVVLTIKVIALSAIWHAFFSSPLDEHLTDAKLGDYLFNPVPPSQRGADRDH